ncbi:hypothetical protein [Pelosinus sp. sgz500959]|uniref:hypothetical protein n=1 Tax=Pelosinus sp. sgz500959 TaxID=3242472 RepID=UPI00366CB1A1
MFLLNFKDIITEELEMITPGVECMSADEELIIYRKKWIDSPFVDIVGFVPLFLNEDANQWRQSEKLFLRHISKELHASKDNVEPSLAYLYEPSDIDALMDVIVRIERNAMHCRKFVLPMEEAIHEHIMRLPIASLRNSREREMLPQSAKKVLIQAGLGFECANGILTQSKMNKILDNLPDNIDKNKIGKVSAIREAKEAFPLKQTRLVKLNIEAFRAYGKEQQFDLDADLIVIGGPNGLGKTSFFDAVDYVTTGQVKRFNKRLKSLPNLFYRDQMKVSLTAKVVENGKNEDFIITRGLPDHEVRINNEIKNRKDVLLKLTQTTYKENVERLVNLFRASHLSNQYQAELTEGIRKESTLPYDLLGRMLSLEDYVQGINRLEKARDVVEKEINEIECELTRLGQAEKEINNELGQFKMPVEQQNFDKKEIEYEALVGLGNSVGGNVSEIEGRTLLERLKELRSIVEVRKTETETKLNDLYVVHNWIGERDNLTQKNQVIKPQLVKEQNNQTVIKEKREQFERRLSDLLQLKLEKENAIKRVAADVGNHEWLLIQIPLLKQASDYIQSLSVELKKAEGEVASIKKNITVEENILGQIKIESDRLQVEYNKNQQSLCSLKKLQEDIPKYIDALQQFQLIEQAKVEMNITLMSQKQVLAQSEEEYLNARNNLNIIMIELEFERNALDKTRSLVHQLRDLIRGSNCPLCGHDHNSKEQLLALIDKQYEEESVALTSKTHKYDVEKGNLVVFEKVYNQSQQEVQKSIDSIRKLEVDEISYNNSLCVLRERFSVAGFNNLKRIEEEIMGRISDLVSLIKNNAEELKESQDQYESKFQSIQILVEKRGNHERVLRNYYNEIKEKERFIGALNTEILIKGLPENVIGTEVEELIYNYKKKREQIVEKKEVYEKEISYIEDQFQKTDIDYKNCNLTVNDLEITQRQIENQLNNLFSNIKGKKMAPDFSEETLLQRVSEMKSNLSQIEDIREKILIAEIRADSKERSAAVSRLLDRQKKIDLEKEDKVLALNVAKKKITMLSNIQGMLKEIQKGNLEKYCKAIGPIATIIQRRLRPVYGFGKVDICPSGSNIPVRIGFEKDQFLAPGDYLSESQMGIIALSIFLCIATTQTWSGLQTIMLDDPILHFDDLNVYAFAELLRSWIISSDLPVRPQIIISTCDDRLIRILRMKFQGMVDQGNAKFYMFKSISKDGPIIEQFTVKETPVLLN